MKNQKRLNKFAYRCAPLLLTIPLLTGCLSMPSATAGVVTKEMDFSDFDTLEISDAFTAHVTQGDEYKVTIEVDEHSLPYLDAYQQGDTVKIGMLPRPFFMFWMLYNRGILRAEITMPKLVSLSERDASHVDVGGFSSEEESRFELSDASSLEGEIDTGNTQMSAADASTVDLEGNRGDVEIKASDASKVTLRGTGGNVTISAADASHVDLSEFASVDAEIKATDASYVTVNASGTLNADAQDASIVRYSGNPTVGDTNTRDSSTIEQQD